MRYLLIPAFTLIPALTAALLGACATGRLHDEQARLRLPPAALSMAEGVRTQPTTAAPTAATLGASGPARAEGGAPAEIAVPTPPRAARRALAPGDLSFLGLDLDARAWEAARAPDFTPTAPLSEAEALIVFLARNPDVQAAWSTRVGAAQRYGQALHLRRLVEQYQGFVRRPDALRPSYPLPNVEALAGRVVDRDVALAQVAFERRVLGLLARFTASFYGARFQRHALAIRAEDLSVSERFAAVVRARYGTGKAKKSDLLKAKMRLSDAREQLKSTRERLGAARAQLASLLNLRGDVRPGGATTPLTIPRLELVRAAAATAPSLRAAELRQLRAEATLELAETRINPALAPGLSETRGRPVRAPLPATFAAGAPFLEELRDRTAALTQAAEQARTAVPAEAEAAHARLSNAVRDYRLYRGKQVARAKEALAAAESEYRVGRASFLHLDDVQRLWLRTSLAGQRLERDAHVARAGLWRLLGRWTKPSSDTATRGEGAR